MSLQKNVQRSFWVLPTEVFYKINRRYEIMYPLNSSASYVVILRFQRSEIYYQMPHFIGTEEVILCIEE